MDKPMTAEMKPEQRHRDAAQALPHCHEDESAFDYERRALKMLPGVFAKFEAEHLSTPADAGLREALESLRTTFSIWLEQGPSAQPNYPTGMRPFSTGDLKYFVSTFDAALQSSQPPTSGDQETLTKVRAALLACNLEIVFRSTAGPTNHDAEITFSRALRNPEILGVIAADDMAAVSQQPRWQTEGDMSATQPPTSLDGEQEQGK